jgi:carbon monoxide dehydrogenase subunit G
MPSAQRTISMNTTPEKAFAFFSDPANDMRWRPGVKEISAMGAPAVGAKVHQVVAGPGGRGIAADIEVTAYEPPTHYAFKVIAGPARPNGEFRIRPTASGVDVTFSLDAELGGLKKFLLGRPVQGSMNAEMAALDTAKQLLEGAESAP